MKPYLPFVSIIVSFSLFLIAQECPGQQTGAPDSLHTKLFSAAREIMASSRTCTLITLDREGRPAARIMDPFPPDEDFTIWFGTNQKSRKAAQITHDPRATVLYVAPDQSGYVMIQGEASLINEQEEKDRRWKNEWEQFYPGNRENYTLIRFIPARFEIVSYPHGISGDPVTWEPPSVSLKQK